MTTPLDQTRADFEAYTLSRNVCTRLYRHPEAAGGRYRTITVQHAWEAWQAAIASRAAEVGALQAELAGNEASAMHLSRMVDDLQQMLAKAMTTMRALHNAASPIDESCGDMDARIPLDAFTDFVNSHAELLYAVRQCPYAAPNTPQDPPTAAEAAKETT